MNCDCIETIEAKAQERFNREGQFKGCVERVELSKSIVGVMSAGMLTTTYTNSILTVSGRKSNPRIPILHVYCPFCGTKIKDEEGEAA